MNEQCHGGKGLNSAGIRNGAGGLLVLKWCYNRATGKCWVSAFNLRFLNTIPKKHNDQWLVGNRYYYVLDLFPKPCVAVGQSLCQDYRLLAPAPSPGTFPAPGCREMSASQYLERSEWRQDAVSEPLPTPGAQNKEKEKYTATSTCVAY